MKKNRIFNIFVIVIFFTISFLLCTKYFQNDTFYTIKLGESILKNGIDMKDHFSWIPNLTYVYPHFLYDIFIYILYDVGGFYLIYVSTIVLSFILILLMYFLTSKVSGNKVLSFLLVVSFSSFLTYFFTARAQLVSYIFLLLILYSIEQLRKTKYKRYYFFLFLFSLLTAYCHLAVWPFIFTLFLPYIVQDLVYLLCKKFNLKFVSKFNVEIEKSELFITLKGFVLYIVTGFLTPNFLVPFTYFIKTRSGVSMNDIVEHLPITINNGFIVYLLLLLFVILLLYKNNKIKISDFFLLSGLFVLSFLSFRNISLLFILSIFSFSRLLNNFHFKELEFVILNKYFNCFFIVFSVFILLFSYDMKRDSKYVSEQNYPVAASNYIIENLDYKNIRLFNDYDFGSYLMFKNIPVFIDSRADLYLGEFNNGCEVFIDSQKIYDTAKYEEIFEKYNITHVILKKDSFLIPLLQRDSLYKELYVDDYFVIFDRLTKK